MFIAACVIKGLKALHDKSLLHRDIKPDNLVINSRTGYVSLIDCGVSSPTGTCNDSGSLDYMSLEALEGRPQSYSSDLYSLGVLLYELI